MAFFAILEPVLGILIVALLISQCLLPEIAGRPWFPMFRRTYSVRSDIAEAKEEISTDELLTKLYSLKKGETTNAVPTENPDRSGGADPGKRP